MMATPSFVVFYICDSNLTFHSPLYTSILNYYVYLKLKTRLKAKVQITPLILGGV